MLRRKVGKFTLALVGALALMVIPFLTAKALLICNCVAQSAFQSRAEEAEQLVIMAGQKFYEARAYYASLLSQLEAGKTIQALPNLVQAIEALSQAIQLYKIVIYIGETVGIKTEYIKALKKVDYAQLGAELQAKPEIWQVIAQLGQEGDVLGLFKEGVRRFEQNRALLEDLYGLIGSGLSPSIDRLMRVSVSLHQTTLFGIYTSALAKKVDQTCK
jgi:cellobiose-specific phosphotransferase system component IIA